MSRFSQRLAVAVALLVGSSEVKAQEGSIQWYQQNIRIVLSNSRNLIEAILTRQQLEIAKSIEYVVTGSSGIGAFAAYENDRRLVVIHAGTFQVLDWMFEAIQRETSLSQTGCYKDYVSYLQQGIQENTQRVANQLPPRPVGSPGAYAATHQSNCVQISTAEFARGVPDFGEQRAKQMEASIMFLYLHELGHHVLGHTTNSRANQPSSLAMTRSKENDADRFAIVTALKARYNLTVATPWNAFVAAFGGNSIEAEHKSDHPLGLRRVLTIFDETVRYYESNPTAWPDRQTYSTVVADLKKQRDTLQKQIEELGD